MNSIVFYRQAPALKLIYARNYDWKYTMSGLLQYAIPQKALERTMSKELAYKIVRDRRMDKFFGAEIERRESFNNLT